MPSIDTLYDLLATKQFTAVHCLVDKAHAGHKIWVRVLSVKHIINPLHTFGITQNSRRY